MSYERIGKKGLSNFNNLYGQQRISAFCFGGGHGYWKEDGEPKGCIGTTLLPRLMMDTRPYTFDCATKGTVELQLTYSTQLFYISKGWLYGPGIDPKRRPEIPDKIRKSWDFFIEGKFPDASSNVPWVREVRLSARIIKSLWVLELMARTVEKGGLTLLGNPTFSPCEPISPKQFKLLPVTNNHHVFEQLHWLLVDSDGESEVAQKLLEKSFYIPLWSQDDNEDGYAASDSYLQSRVCSNDVLTPCKTLPFIWAHPYDNSWYINLFSLTDCWNHPRGPWALREGDNDIICEPDGISVDDVEEILPRICKEYEDKGESSLLPDTVDGAWAVQLHKLPPAQAAEELRDAINIYSHFVGYAEHKWPDHRAKRMIYNIMSALPCGYY